MTDSIQTIIMCNRYTCDNEIIADNHEEAWAQAEVEGWEIEPIDEGSCLLGQICKKHAEEKRSSGTEVLATRDPETQRHYVHRWGVCPSCERESLLYTHVSHRYWRCGECLKPRRRALE